MSRPASLLKLEQDAYYAVLRALAVNELDWTKEKLLTDLRKVLNITNDQHFKFLEEVMEDKLVLRLQDSKNQAPAAQVATTPTFDMPPPRQQPPGQASSGQRKPGRPPSATLKTQPSATSPLRARASRITEPSLSGEKRGRPKRDRDEGFEPRRSLGHVKSIKASFGGRSRGRGRRISGLTREPLPLQQSAQVTHKYKVVPFRPEFMQERLANGSNAEIEDMHAALVHKESVLQHHLDLIQQLEDESLGTKDPLRFCQILIEELELADDSISRELESLREAGDDDL